MTGTPSPKLCFVIMPFKEQRWEVFEYGIAPACAQTGFQAVRVDQLQSMSNITREIIEHIFHSEVIIAEVTDQNPNVFYEMGVAHAIGNKTIMIAQRAADLPFDIRNYRCIIYQQSVEGLQRLQKDLVASLQEIEKWRTKPSNPVQDFKPRDVFVLQSDFDKLQKTLQQKDELLATAQKQLSAPKSSPPPPKKILRAQPRAMLVQFAVQMMLKEKDFFDSYYNQLAQGLQHQYEKIMVEGQALVIDHATGLTWQQSGSDNRMTFAQAEQYVRDLNGQNFAGYNDWRLPTLEEAVSLMECKKNNAGLYINSLFDGAQIFIWTADKFIPGVVSWCVNFSNGSSSEIYVFIRNYARAVRRRQS